MKKPKATPAPTPLEMAQEITTLHAASKASPLTGGGPEWEAMEEMLMQHGPTVCAAYVSLHARNLELIGDPFGKQLAEVEAERDALRLATMLNDDMTWARKCIKLYTAAIPTCFPDPAEVLAWFCSLADESAQLRERVEALEAAQRWVPVTERLPPPLDDETHSDWVQVAEADGDVSQAFLDWETGIWHNDGARLHVTHWQPLPTAPAGEGDGAK